MTVPDAVDLRNRIPEVNPIYPGQIFKLEDIPELLEAYSDLAVIACMRGKGRSPEMAELITSLTGLPAVALDGGLEGLTRRNRDQVVRVLSLPSNVVAVVDPVELQANRKVEEMLNAINRYRTNNVIVADRILEIQKRLRR